MKNISTVVEEMVYAFPQVIFLFYSHKMVFFQNLEHKE